jgi:hypothetical protein
MGIKARSLGGTADLGVTTDIELALGGVNLATREGIDLDFLLVMGESAGIMEGTE